VCGNEKTAWSEAVFLVELPGIEPGSKTPFDLLKRGLVLPETT
jgi:hypothetical protein